MRHAHIRTVTDPATGKVYPIPAGGAEDPVPDPQPDPEPDEDPETLGEPGIKALQQERDARKAAEKKAKRVDDLEAELEDLRNQQMSEQEKAIAEARKEAAAAAREEVFGEVRRDLLETRAVRAATGKLANPDLAPKLIEDFDDLDPDDPEAISAAVDQLLEREPYLAASATQPVGDSGGGPRPDRDEPDPEGMDMDAYRKWRSERRAS